MVLLSKVLAFAGAYILASLVIFMCFAIAVFGRLDMFYAGIGLLNLLICGLVFKAVFKQPENHLWTGLEFTVYGLASISARFVITDLAFLPCGILIVAGILTLVGSRFETRQERQFRG